MYSAFLRRDVPGILVDLDDDTASKLLLIAEISTNRKSESGKATIENEGFRYLFWKSPGTVAAHFRKRLSADVSRNSLQPDCYYPRREQPKTASKFCPGSDVNLTMGNGRSADPAARQYPSQYPARFGIKGI